MIVELAGLPATGKTTRARALASELGVTIVQAPEGKFGLFFEGMTGALMRPRAAYALYRLIAREPDARVRRSLFINAWLGAHAKYRRARGDSVVDQGYVQALIAALPGPGDESLVARALRGVPRGARIEWCEAPASVRAARLRKRSRAPRAEFGPSAQDRFNARSEAAYAFVRRLYEQRVASRATVGRDARAFMKRLGFLVAYGLRSVARIVSRESEVVILMYHAVDRSGWKLSVTPEEFERQMAYLSRRGFAAPLSAVVAYAKGAGTLPRRVVAVTFDDGYADLVPVVLPILKKYRIPVTIFLNTDTAVLTKTPAALGLARASWGDIETLAQSGLVAVESHGRTHSHLSRLSEAEVRAELAGARDDITARLGTTPRFFAYPYGDRSREVERLVKEAGYEAAFGITDGTVRPGQDLFALPRVQIDGTMSFALFRLRLSAAVDWNRRLARALRAIMPV